jgi:hypothetical protein
MGKRGTEMNTEQRQLIYDALMSGAPDDVKFVVQLAEIVTHDIDKIEPVIDAMLDAARLGSMPMDWSKEEFKLDVIRDGVTCHVEVKVGIRRFSLVVPCAKMKLLGEFLVKESGV